MKTTSPNKVIDQFFWLDGQIENNRAKKSVLLALIQDMEFCMGTYSKWKEMKLNSDQMKLRDAMLPSFAVVSLYCSGIDLIARIIKKRPPNNNETAVFFKECARSTFNFSDEETEALWQLRCSVSHSYTLGRETTLGTLGSWVMEKTNKGQWKFCLRPMLLNLRGVKEIIYSNLLQGSPENIQATAIYLESSGFFYVPTS